MAFQGYEAGAHPIKGVYAVNRGERAMMVSVPGGIARTDWKRPNF
jgi:hypothetical protein